MSLPARDFGLRTVAPFILILAGGLALFGANAMNRPGRNDVTPEVSDPGSLMDLRGAKRQLGALGGDRGLVCCFLGVDCPVTEAYVDDLRRLHEEFSARGVAVVAIYSGASDHMNRVAAHALDCEFPFDVLIDRYQRMARNLGVERTPTFCLVDANRRLRYVGRFDDRFISEHQQQTPESADLRQAIEAVISQQDPPIARTVANGSPIEPWRRRRSDEPPAYAEHVAPIIERRCQTCHHRAGAGPFPLETEMQVARMRYVIADAVAQRRMPPWHADERFGEFHNDRRLTDEERRTLLSWAVQRGGRELQRPGRTRDQRRGSLADPVPWSIGEPDAIVDCADEFEIPAAGEITVKYSRVSKETTEALFEEVRWIQAAEVLPGNIQAVNHIAAFVTEPGSTLNMGPVTSGNILAEWTPGVPSFEFPPGTAFRVPRGARLVFEIHYRAIGVNVVDRPQLALRFADAAPEHEIQVATQYHDSFRIPRFAPQYTADFELEFACDTRLLGLFPRMRRRGSAFRFEATYPDGATETLLSIPRYDAAWQTTYWLDEPKPMPQGTRIRAIAHWDNSPGNAANPDPGVDVVHGARANDEMMATRG